MSTVPPLLCSTPPPIDDDFGEDDDDSFGLDSALPGGMTMANADSADFDDFGDFSSAANANEESKRLQVNAEKWQNLIIYLLFI